MNEYSKKPLIKFHRGAVVYLLLLIFGLIFTQALRSPASAVLFWFLILMLVFSIIYVLIGKLALRVDVGSDTTKAEKMTPVEYEMRIINSSPFAYPFLEAIIAVPQADGVRCDEQSLTVNLPPLGHYAVKHTTNFKYRGNYEIGVICIYISDFLHLFSLKLDVDVFNNVLVYPRKLNMDMKLPTSASDIPNDSANVVFSTEKAEISNIREYIPGDSLKSIHWKLSSKTPSNLMVKDFNTNTSRNVYFLVDFSRAIPTAVFTDDRMAQERLKAEKEAQKAAEKGRKAVKLKPSKEERAALAAEKAVKKADKKAEKRMRKGQSEMRAGDAAMIDDLIKNTSDTKLSDERKMRMKAKEEALDSKSEKIKSTSEILAERAAAESKKKADAAAESLAVGGTVKAEYAADMDEFCADGVVEAAIAAILNELNNGNTVTLVWFDARMESGIAGCELSSPDDFEVIYSTFASAPACPEDMGVTKLLPLIKESLNVTIRIVTSNIDPLSLNNYAMIPGLYGGAGTGCVCDVMLFNPVDRYESEIIRREYVELSKIRLATQGVSLSELITVKDETGHYTVRKAD